MLYRHFKVLILLFIFMIPCSLSAQNRNIIWYVDSGYKIHTFNLKTGSDTTMYENNRVMGDIAISKDGEIFTVDLEKDGAVKKVVKTFGIPGVSDSYDFHSYGGLGIKDLAPNALSFDENNYLYVGYYNGKYYQVKDYTDPGNKSEWFDPRDLFPTDHKVGSAGDVIFMNGKAYASITDITSKQDYLVELTLGSENSVISKRVIGKLPLNSYGLASDGKSKLYVGVDKTIYRLDLSHTAEASVDYKITTTAVGTTDETIYGLSGEMEARGNEGFIKVDVVSEFSTSQTFPANETIIPDQNHKLKLDAVLLDSQNKPQNYHPLKQSNAIPMTVLFYAEQNSVSHSEIIRKKDNPGQPVVAIYQTGENHTQTTAFDDFTLPDGESNVSVKYLDFYDESKVDLQSCANSSQIGNLKGLPQCVNADNADNKYKEVFGQAAYDRCKNNDTYGNPCKSSNKGVGKAPYDHEYGCYECTIDALWGKQVPFKTSAKIVKENQQVEEDLTSGTCSEAPEDLLTFNKKFVFDKNNDVTGNGEVGTVARYKNIATYNGEDLDLLVKVEDLKNMSSLYIGNSTPKGFKFQKVNGSDPSVGFFIADNSDDPKGTVYDATLRFTFVKHGTDDPVAVNFETQVYDIDNFGNRKEQVKINKDDYLFFQTSDDSEINGRRIGDMDLFERTAYEGNDDSEGITSNEMVKFVHKDKSSIVLHFVQIKNKPAKKSAGRAGFNLVFGKTEIGLPSCQQEVADICENSFKSVLNSTLNDISLTGAVLIKNNNNPLVTKTLIATSALCDNGLCRKSNTIAPLYDFDIDLGSGKDGNRVLTNTIKEDKEYSSFNSVGIGAITINGNRTIKIQSDLNLAGATSIKINGNVKIYAKSINITGMSQSAFDIENGSLTLYSKGDITYSGASFGGDSTITLIANNDIKIAGMTTMKAIMYAKEDIQVAGTTSITGALTAKSIKVGSGAQFTYDSSAVQDFCHPNEFPELSISDVEKEEGDQGYTDFNFTVTLDKPVDFREGVDTGFWVTFTDGVDAEAPVGTAGVEDTHNGTEADFKAQARYILLKPSDDGSLYRELNEKGDTETIYLPRGRKSFDITVKVKGDLFVEPDEEFYVDLYSPDNLVIADSRGVGTILNDDIPMECSTDSYLFKKKNTNVYTYDLYTGESTLKVTDPFGEVVNGIGFNQLDGSIWGYATRKRSNGSEDDLSERALVKVVEKNGQWLKQKFDIEGLPKREFNVGDVSADGKLYLKNAYNSHVYVVDVNESSPTFLTLLRTFELKPSNVNGVDWAFHPIDHKLYMVNSGKKGIAKKLYRIDPQTGDVEDLGDTGISKGRAFGAVFFDKNGYFYLSDSGSGDIYRIDITDSDHIDPTALYMTKGVAAGNNDGARCNQSYITAEPIINFKSIAQVKEGDAGITDVNLTFYSDRPLDGMLGGLHFDFNMTKASADSDDYVLHVTDYHITKITDKEYVLTVPLVRGDLETETNEMFTVSLTSDNLLLIKGASSVKVQILDDDYNIFNAWDVGSGQKKIVTKIVAEPFNLKIVKLNKKGEIVTDGIESDTKVRIVDQSVCAIEPFDHNMSGFVDFNLSALTNGLRQFQYDEGLKEAKVQFYWKDENITRTSCSSDSFAIRPKKFEIELSNELVAGNDFNITVKAVDANGNSVQNYNESAAVGFDYNNTKAGQGCINGMLDTNSTIHFRNGVAVIGARYSEIGKVRFRVYEKGGDGDAREYAYVDRADTIPETKSLITQAVKVSDVFKPAKVIVSWDFKPGDEISGVTYYNSFDTTHTPADGSVMAALLDLDVKVKSEDDKPLKNFTKECAWAQGIPLDVNTSIENANHEPLEIAAQYMDRNGTIIPESDESITRIPTTLAAGASSLNLNGFKLDKSLFDQGEGKKRLYFNIKRRADQPLNPMRLRINGIKAADGALGADVDASSDGTPKETTFFYARAHIPDQTFVGTTGEASIFYEVYCKDCNRTKYGLDHLPESVDSINWYQWPTIAESSRAFVDNDRFDNFNDISPVDNDTISARALPPKLSAISQNVAGNRLNLSVSKAPFKTRIKYKPKSYLIFNRFNANADTQRFVATFLPKEKSWAGKGDLGFTVDTNLNPRNNFDIIDW